MVPSLLNDLTINPISFCVVLSISFEGHDNQDRDDGKGSWTINPLLVIVRVEKRNLKHPDEEGDTFTGASEESGHDRPPSVLFYDQFDLLLAVNILTRQNCPQWDGRLGL